MRLDLRRLPSLVVLACKLGFVNIARVLLHRVRLRLGLFPMHDDVHVSGDEAFFSAPRRMPEGLQPRRDWQTHQVMYGQKGAPLQGNAPAWLERVPPEARTKPWWSLSDFDSGMGDIKDVWEPSRFEWAVPLAQRAAVGEHASLERLNGWLRDWLVHNPPYLGPNWKCGQEAAIRVLNLTQALLVLGQELSLSTGLAEVLKLHLRRVGMTLGYAIAQQNNHATSEAAALYVGGALLEASGESRDGRRLREKGARLLNRNLSQLVMADGSFSQYSTNYHRLVVDTLCIVELVRRRLSLPSIGRAYSESAERAIAWLYAMVDRVSGFAPNIGSNDSARLLAFDDRDLRDFRVTLELSSRLFRGCSAFPDADIDQALAWVYAENAPPGPTMEKAVTLHEGGFFVLRTSRALAVLRYPRFRFRPGQSDLLHLDLWVEGRNILRDGGSYRYNTSPEVMAYFSGVASHNSVQFDDRDQMPRISRFLFGDWPEAEDVVHAHVDESGRVSASAAYRDSQGARHHRHVSLAEDEIHVVDKVEGFSRKAVLRWRLAPAEWEFLDSTLASPLGRLSFSFSGKIRRCELVEGYESRYYGQKTLLPVLEIEVDEPGELHTRVEFS